MAALHPQLAEDCLPLGRFPLCRLLLMRDANYPWFILVPDRGAVSEIYQLSGEDQQQLMRESAALSRALAEQWRADKLNVAALGNVVPQLHIHHIVRFRGDPAWPAPVWGRVPPRAYAADALAEVADRVRRALAAQEIPFRVEPALGPP